MPLWEATPCAVSYLPLHTFDINPTFSLRAFDLTRQYCVLPFLISHDDFCVRRVTVTSTTINSDHLDHIVGCSSPLTSSFHRGADSRVTPQTDALHVGTSSFLYLYLCNFASLKDG